VSFEGVMAAPLQTHVTKKIVTPLHGPGRSNESPHPFVDLGHPNKSSYPFMDLVSQTNPCARQPSCPLGPMHPSLGALLMSMCPNLLVASYLGNPLGAFACPRHPLSQLVKHLGVEATPSLVSMRTWERVFAPF
jgi:hypothetical protein